MDAFPFSKADRQRICDATSAITNATLADDDVLAASCFLTLQEVLQELRVKYGDHPNLLETEADFQDDPTLAREGYVAAIRLAEEHALPTFTIRIWLARLLLDHFDDARQARLELNACKEEMQDVTDEWYHEQWREVMEECEGAQSGGA